MKLKKFAITHHSKISILKSKNGSRCYCEDLGEKDIYIHASQDLNKPDSGIVELIIKVQCGILFELTIRCVSQPSANNNNGCNLKFELKKHIIEMFDFSINELENYSSQLEKEGILLPIISIPKKSLQKYFSSTNFNQFNTPKQ